MVILNNHRLLKMLVYQTTKMLLCFKIYFELDLVFGVFYAMCFTLESAKN